MKIELFDAPPKKSGAGRPVVPDPLLDEFMALLQRNPGKWGQFPEKRTKAKAVRVKNAGFKVSLRNADPKTKIGDLWACWPKENGPAKVEIVSGKALQCTTCDWTTTADRIKDLEGHTLARHKRPPAKVERTPVTIDADDTDPSDDDTPGDESDAGDE